MKRTRKFQSLGDVQAVLDTSPDLSVATKRLGINRSTLTRWLQQGKVKRPGSLPAAGPPVVVPATAEGWRDGVLAGHALTDTDRTLVEGAEGALLLARAKDTPAFTRLAAMREFRGAVKQLNLDAKRLGAEKDAERPVAAQANARPRHRTGDPRAALMVVK